MGRENQDQKLKKPTDCELKHYQRRNEILDAIKKQPEVYFNESGYRTLKNSVPIPIRYNIHEATAWEDAMVLDKSLMIWRKLMPLETRTVVIGMFRF
jgi:hypothetical protein